MILQTQKFKVNNRVFEVLRVSTGKDTLYECLEIAKNEKHYLTASKFEELKDENKIELL